MAGYTRQRTIADGNTIAADLFNGEYNQIVKDSNIQIKCCKSMVIQYRVYYFTHREQIFH